MEAPDHDFLSTCSGLPTLVLTSSGLVQGENEGARRLAGLPLGKDVLDTNVGRNINDLGIIMVPTNKPVYRALDAMLSAAALHVRKQTKESLNRPDQQVYLLSEAACGEDVEKRSTRFWDEEELIAPTEVSDVIIPRRKSSGCKQAGLNALGVRAKLTARAVQTRLGLTYVLTFDRPAFFDPLSVQSTLNKLTNEQTETRERNPYELSRGLLNPKIMADQSGLGKQIIGRLIPHCTGVLDTDGQVLYLSPSWYDFTGLTESQSLGTEWTSAIHSDDATPMLKTWGDVVEQGIDWTTEARYRMRDGSYRWFLIRAEPYREEDGMIRRWYASMLDVNESVLKRLQTERNRESILKLFSEADVSLWGVNQNHEIYIREGALSWTPSRIFQKGEHDTNKVIQDILDGKSSLATLEHQMDDRWYRTRFVTDLDRFSDDKDGKPVVQAALGLTIDITDVRARSKLQMENEALISNERAARESTRLKSSFLANMSHEIRTPISGIIGLSDLMLESVQAQEQEELTGGIKQSAVFLLSLINDILDFSKIESGHMDIEEVSFVPKKVIHDLLQMIRLQAKENGLDLVYDTTLPEDLAVVGDPGRLRQVLTNLLSNSIKFTEKGSVKLTVGVVEAESDQGNGDKASSLSEQPTESHDNIITSDIITLRFVVKDTGCGISQETMKKLFKPFAQADSSTARMHGGTGLGLTISRQLVEMMGGRIELTSYPSVGTTAEFHVPYICQAQSQRANASLSTTKPSIEKPLAANSIPTSGSVTTTPALCTHQSQAKETERLSPGERFKTHVLVVEDNAVNQRIATANLRKLGFSVAAVCNGEEALAYLDCPPSSGRPVPDVILMDCMMPVLDGYEATKIIRYDGKRYNKAIRNIPVIAMTASAIQGDREKCENAGMDDYMTKPTSKDTLQKMIHKWISKRSRASDVE